MKRLMTFFLIFFGGAFLACPQAIAAEAPKPAVQAAARAARLVSKEDKEVEIISKELQGRVSARGPNGYAPFEYQFVSKTDGTVVWQTSQTNPAGTKVSWYGVWNGKMIRGVLSERPVVGSNRDFSFMSVGRGKNGA